MDSGLNLSTNAQSLLKALAATGGAVRLAGLTAGLADLRSQWSRHVEEAEERLFPHLVARGPEADGPVGFCLAEHAALSARLADLAAARPTPEQIRQLTALDSQMWARPNSVMVEWARTLPGRGLKTAVLSNMSRSVGDYLRREAKWLEMFHHLCFSGELKMGKPEPGIYHSCLASLGIPVTESLFIDDREVNIEAAEALGMRAILFRTAKDLLPELTPYGLADSLAEVLARAC